MGVSGKKVTAFAIAAAAIAVACVEKDPIVTGNRTASAEAGASAITVVPAPDLSDDDAPDCRRCSETLSTDTARGTLCRKNGAKPSVQLLNDVVDCVCYDKCIQECASYCSGSIREDSCAPCILDNCVDPYYACLEDKVQ
jgi:hypothetical protein